jgi:hypothetical protein
VLRVYKAHLGSQGQQVRQDNLEQQVALEHLVHQDQKAMLVR